MSELIDKGIALGDKEARYPIDFQEQNEIELWLNMKAFSFTQLKVVRQLDLQNLKCNMWLPMPTSMVTGTDISYSGGGSEQGLLTRTINAVTTLGSIGNLFTGILGFFEDISGVSNALGKRDMDQRENIFNGANLRNHKFDWTFVPKTPAASARLFSMAYRLNALAYPGAAAQTKKMYHPPLFTLQVWQTNGGKERPEWSFDPQICVLKGCSIDRTGAGQAYAIGEQDFLPAAWKISLEFTEFEPLVRSMVNDRLVSRSSSDTIGLGDAFVSGI